MYGGDMFPIVDKRETGINIRKIMDCQGLTAKDVQQYLELGCVQSVYRWFDGVSMPTVDNLYALSELFKMPMDCIVCGNRQSSYFHCVEQYNESQIRRISKYYKMLKNNQIA